MLVGNVPSHEDASYTDTCRGPGSTKVFIKSSKKGCVDLHCSKTLNKFSGYNFDILGSVSECETELYCLW